MKTTIYAFLKFFQEERFAREFVAGRLYLNPLAYFRGLENGSDDGRGDPHEGLLAWHQPSTLSIIKVGNVVIHPTDLAGPVIVQPVAAKALNVLCLYSIASGDFAHLSTANIDAFREHLRVPSRCRDMGSLAVLVRQPRIFIERVVAAVNRQRFGLEAGPVNYFDPKTFSGALARPAFAKRNEFSWQREYRFVVDRGGVVPEACTLDIGSVADLCATVDAAAVLESPTVTLRGEEM